MLDDLAFQGHLIQPGLILREDFPARPEYLPRALSPEDDRRLQDELRRAGDCVAPAIGLTKEHAETRLRLPDCQIRSLDTCAGDCTAVLQRGRARVARAQNANENERSGDNGVQTLARETRRKTTVWGSRP